MGGIELNLDIYKNVQMMWQRTVDISASKRSIGRFVTTEKAPTRAFSWLKAATTAFTFKTLLRHYAKRALTHGIMGTGIPAGGLLRYRK